MNIFFYIVVIISFLQSACYAGKHVEYSEADNQFIVHNTQGQAIQAIQVPAFDLLSSKLFNPANKRVVEVIETEGLCEFPYFDKLYRFTYPITTEITLAHPEDPDNLFVFKGLSDSNRVFIDDIEERFETCYSITPDQTPLHVVGYVEQHNLSLLLSTDLLVSYPEEYKALISEMIHRLRGEIFQVWSVLKQGSEDCLALRELGFHKNYVFPDLDDGGNEALYSLIMDESQLLKKSEPVGIPASSRIDEVEEEESSNESVIEEEECDEEGYCYSFLVRNEEGRILGGIYGGLDFEAVTPYSLIIKIWVSPEHRGMGLGGRLLDLAEEYTLDAGVRIMELGTSEFQAPWLYESKGYKSYLCKPKFKRLRDGSFADRVEYRKYLS